MEYERPQLPLSLYVNVYGYSMALNVLLSFVAIVLFVVYLFLSYGDPITNSETIYAKSEGLNVDELHVVSKGRPPTQEELQAYIEKYKLDK